MRSLSDTIVSDLQYEATLESGLGIGHIVIRGITMPNASNTVTTRNHEPLVDIWCAVRKKVAHKWRVNVSTYFVYGEDTATGTLCLSAAGLYGDALLEKLQLFEKHFDDIVELFMQIIEEWIIDEKCGYLLYLKYSMPAGDNFSPEIAHAIMSRFLYCIGLKAADVHHDRELKKRVRAARRRSQR